MNIRTALQEPSLMATGHMWVARSASATPHTLQICTKNDKKHPVVIFTNGNKGGLK